MTDLYGFMSDDLETLKAMIEPVLGIKMDAHESSFRCGNYYFRRLASGDEFALQKNRDPVHGELNCEEYPEMEALLFVSTSERADDLKQHLLKRIIGLYHLERTSLTKERSLSVVKMYRGTNGSKLS